MGQPSTIECTDVTWNPIVSCRAVSAGCANCFVENGYAPSACECIRDTNATPEYLIHELG